MTTENWKDIPDFEGRYQVSDQGRVRGLAKVLRPQVINSGYLVVHLHKNGTRTVALVHRLVAGLFIPRATGQDRVNHINADKHDNAAANLEWCDHAENMAHAKASGLMRPNRHEVFGTHSLTGYVVGFASQRDAEYALSGTRKQSSAINHCLSGKKKSAYGYFWSRNHDLV